MSEPRPEVDGAGGEEEIPWLSFSDAVTALLFVFIATTFWFMFELRLAVAKQNAETARLTGANVAAGQLLQGVEVCLTQRTTEGVRVRPVVEKDSRTMSLYIEPRASTVVEWFQVCSAQITDDAAAVVDMARDCLAKEVPGLTDDYTVVLTLEGHTDARPPMSNCRERFPSNWELSGARAGAALRRLLCEDGQCTPDALASAADLRALAQDRDRLQVVAAGRAESIPAWRALCATDWTGAAALPELDRAVCAALSDEDTPLSTRVASVRTEISAALGTGYFGRTLDTSDLALVAWANDPGCMGGKGDAAICAERFRRLRRVDMRVDLRPRPGAAEDRARADRKALGARPNIVPTSRGAAVGATLEGIANVPELGEDE